MVDLTFFKGKAQLEKVLSKALLNKLTFEVSLPAEDCPEPEAPNIVFKFPEYLGVLFERILVVAAENKGGEVVTLADVAQHLYANRTDPEAKWNNPPTIDVFAVGQMKRTKPVYPIITNVDVITSKNRRVSQENGDTTTLVPLLQLMTSPEYENKLCKSILYVCDRSAVDTFHNRYIFVPVLLPYRLIVGCTPMGSIIRTKSEIRYSQQKLLNIIYANIADKIGWEHPLMKLLLTANEVTNDLQLLKETKSYLYSASEMVAVRPTWAELEGFLVTNLMKSTSTLATTYTHEVYKETVYYGYEPTEFVELDTKQFDTDAYDDRLEIELGITALLVKEVQPSITKSRASHTGVGGETGSGKSSIVYDSIHRVLTDDVHFDDELPKLKGECREIEPSTKGDFRNHLYAFLVADEPIHPLLRMKPILEKSHYKIPKPRAFFVPIFGADFLDLFIKYVVPHYASVTIVLDSITSLLYIEDSHSFTGGGTGLQEGGLRWYSRPLFLRINHLILSSPKPIEFIMTMNIPLDARNVAFLIAGVSDFFVMMDRSRPGQIVVASSFSRHRGLITKVDPSGANILTPENLHKVTEIDKILI